MNTPSTLCKIEWEGLTITHYGEGHVEEITSDRLPSLRFDLAEFDWTVESAGQQQKFLAGNATQLETDLAFAAVVAYYGAAHFASLEQVQQWLREINARPIVWERDYSPEPLRTWPSQP